MGRIAVRKSVLTRVHKSRRLQFCQTKLNFTSVGWSKYIFTDECKVTIDGVLSWNMSGVQRIPPWHLKSTKKFSPLIMVWGSDDRRVLIRANDTIDSLEYQRGLEDGLPLIYNHHFIMQQDGARCHTSRSTMRTYNKEMLDCYLIDRLKVRT